MKSLKYPKGVYKAGFWLPVEIRKRIGLAAVASNMTLTEWFQAAIAAQLEEDEGAK